MRRIGIHLINIMSNEFFSRDNIVYVNGQDISTIALDNGYLYIILRYGILNMASLNLPEKKLSIVFQIPPFSSRKNKESACVLGTLIAVFIANFVDNDLVDYSFLPFILWAFNDWKTNRVIKNVKEKVEEIHKRKYTKI